MLVDVEDRGVVERDVQVEHLRRITSAGGTPELDGCDVVELHENSRPRHHRGEIRYYREPVYLLDE